MLAGDQLIALTHRYPGTVDKPPPGDPDSTTYAWVSNDGGTTFTGPAIVSDEPPNGGAVAWGENGTSVTTISQTYTLGLFAATFTGGSAAFESANLSTGDLQVYEGTLAVNRGLPVAAFTDLAPKVCVRRYTGIGSPNDAANWTAPLSVPGERPALAGGPAGLFLLNFINSGTANLVVRRLTDALDGSSPPKVIAPTGGSTPDLVQDASGRLSAAWVKPGDGGATVVVRSSTDGGSRWSPESVLGAPGNGFNLAQLRMGAAADGGGFAAWENPDQGPPSKVVASPFGTPAQAPGRGAGNLDPSGGGANQPDGVECRKIEFGAVVAIPEEGCFLRDPKKPQSSAGVSDGIVRINGLDIVPTAGAKIVVDPKARTIDSVGAVEVQLRGAGSPIVLFRGELEVKLRKPGRGPDALLLRHLEVRGRPQGLPAGGEHRRDPP